MILSGKPVRILLRGDYTEAAKWIPHFRSLCAAFSGDNQTRYQSSGDMRGKAQIVGGQFYVIDIEAGGDVLFYQLGGGQGTTGINVFRVVAWGESPKPLLIPNEENDNTFGNASVSDYKLDLTLGYQQYATLMAKIGRKLVVFFAAFPWQEVSSLYVRYRKLSSVKELQPTRTFTPGATYWAQRIVLFGNEVLLVRRPVSTDEAENHNQYSMEATGVLRATRNKYDGDTVSSVSVQVAEPRPYPWPELDEFSNLYAFEVCRGNPIGGSGSEVQPTYWAITRARTVDDENPETPTPSFYRRKFKLTVQRRDLHNLASKVAESAELSEETLAGSTPFEYPYALNHYVSFFGVECGVLWLILCRLYTNVPYFGNRDPYELQNGDKRIHVYDLYAYDPVTLEKLYSVEDCGFGRLHLRGDRAYVHGYTEATFAYFPIGEKGPTATFGTFMTGTLNKATIAGEETGNPYPVLTKDEKVSDDSYAVLSPVVYDQMGYLDDREFHKGFCQVFD